MRADVTGSSSYRNHFRLCFEDKSVVVLETNPIAVG